MSGGKIGLLAGGQRLISMWITKTRGMDYQKTGHALVLVIHAPCLELAKFIKGHFITGHTVENHAIKFKKLLFLESLKIPGEQEKSLHFFKPSVTANARA